MNWVDFLIITGLLVSTVISVMRGFVKEFFALLALILGYIIANQTYLPFVNMASSLPFIHLPKWASFVLVFFIAWLIIIFFGKFFKKVISISITLNIVDRIGGGIVGFIKGLTICSFLLMAISSFNFSKSFLRGATTVPLVLTSFRILTSISSSELINEYEKKFKQWQSEVNKKIKSMSTELSNRTVQDVLDNISDEDRKKMEKILKNISK